MPVLTRNPPLYLTKTGNSALYLLTSTIHKKTQHNTQIHCQLQHFAATFNSLRSAYIFSLSDRYPRNAEKRQETEVYIMAQNIQLLIVLLSFCKHRLAKTLACWLCEV